MDGLKASRSSGIVSGRYWDRRVVTLDLNLWLFRFFVPVIDVATTALMDAIDQKMRQGATQFIVLISSPGGSVQS